jgi:hypothetical protein
MQHPQLNDEPEAEVGADSINAPTDPVPRPAFDLTMIYRALIAAYIRQEYDANSPDEAQGKKQIPQHTNS